MTKIDFSDFYKFIVSFGLILLSLAIVIPWLFLRETFNISISKTELSQLTPLAQELIVYRQYSVLWLMRNVVWLSGFIAFIGFIIIGIGLIQWHKRQTLLDHREKLEATKIEIEVAQMTPKQKFEKAKLQLPEFSIEPPYIAQVKYILVVR